MDYFVDGTGTTGFHKEKIKINLYTSQYINDTVEEVCLVTVM